MHYFSQPHSQGLSSFFALEWGDEISWDQGCILMINSPFQLTLLSCITMKSSMYVRQFQAIL